MNSNVSELCKTCSEFVCLFELILYVPSTIFQLQGRVFLGLTSTKLLLKDHNAVTPVRLEPGHVVRLRTPQTIFYFIARNSGKRENNWKTEWKKF